MGILSQVSRAINPFFFVLASFLSWAVQAAAAPFVVFLKPGAGPYAVVAADFNRDGAVDLAAAASLDDVVSVFLNRGQNTFTEDPDRRFLIDLSPFDAVLNVGDVLLAADVDLNRTVDLLVANPRDGQISLLRGLGNGDFGPPATVASLDGAGDRIGGGMAAADFDLDGRTDLAFTARNSNRVVLYKGDGTGGFNNVLALSTPTEPVAVSFGDLDRDGFVDLAVASRSAGTVSVFMNQAGVLIRGDDYPAGEAPVSVRVGEATGNGAFDIVVANERIDEVSVLPGNGTGLLGPPENYAVGLGPVKALVLDTNGDRVPDIVSVNFVSSNISNLLGDGQGSFAPRQDFSVGFTPSDLVLVDLNEDGKPDAVTADFDQDSLTRALNVGDFRIVPGDVNVDGRANEADAALIVDELFDGDGDEALFTQDGFVSLGAASDANGDHVVTAADVVWVLRSGNGR
jgi:hypothetical protein